MRGGATYLSGEANDARHGGTLWIVGILLVSR